MNLRIPGPTPCPPEVLEAMSREMINHRGPTFAGILRNVTAKLTDILQTKGDVFFLTGSGTAGMESAIVNTLSPGDRVLSVSNGYFGERFADIAIAYGLELTKLWVEWGTAVDPDDVGKALASDSSIKAVLVTHNETSTGMTNDLASLSSVVKKYERLLLVDAISGLGSIPLPVDEWGCDVVITGSQKGWMVPPGLAMVSVSEAAWRAHAQAKLPRYYLDYTMAKRFLERGETPFTPAVSVFFALEVALDKMIKEGLPNVFARHARVGQRTRQGAKDLGLSLFPEERYASNTVTAVRAPEGLDVGKLIKVMRDEYQVEMAGGQQKLTGKIFRIGHLGHVSEGDIDEVMEALVKALPAAGFPLPAKVVSRGKEG